MLESHPLYQLDDAQVQKCVVLEEGRRWQSALRQFVGQLVPSPIVLSVTACRASELVPTLHAAPRGILFWEIERSTLPDSLERVRHLKQRFPQLLQLAGTSGLSDFQCLALSEVGVAAIVSHPESLLRLKPALTGHFARSTRRVD